MILAHCLVLWGLLTKAARVLRLELLSEYSMQRSLTRLLPLAVLALSLSACTDASNRNAVYEADVDRSACAPDYSAYYTADLPVRCTPQTALPHNG